MKKPPNIFQKKPQFFFEKKVKDFQLFEGTPIIVIFNRFFVR